MMAGAILLSLTLGVYIFTTFMDRASKAVYWVIIVFGFIFWLIWFIGSCVWLTNWDSHTYKNTNGCDADLWCKMSSDMWNVTLAVLILYFVTLFPSVYFGYKIKSSNFSDLGAGSNVSSKNKYMETVNKDAVNQEAG